ncbi:MAG TPA: hypothetical protein VHS97_14270, partial [Isosphaeraceae bacterium]|nr:hypothetical protein [Isosphaeraceae bacterium]
LNGGPDGRAADHKAFNQNVLRRQAGPRRQGAAGDLKHKLLFELSMKGKRGSDIKPHVDIVTS